LCVGRTGPSGPSRPPAKGLLRFDTTSEARQDVINSLKNDTIGFILLLSRNCAQRTDSDAGGVDPNGASMGRVSIECMGIQSPAAAARDRAEVSIQCYMFSRSEGRDPVARGRSEPALFGAHFLLHGRRRTLVPTLPPRQGPCSGSLHRQGNPSRHQIAMIPAAPPCGSGASGRARSANDGVGSGRGHPPAPARCK
jgi:hypothetical protein